MGPVEQLASHGVLGIVCALLFYWIWRKDLELAAERIKSAEKLQALNDKYTGDVKAEMAARVVDATNYTGLALKLQGEANTQTNRLTDVFDEVRRMVSSRNELRTAEDRETLRERPTMGAPREQPPRLPTSPRSGGEGGGGRYGGGE